MSIDSVASVTNPSLRNEILARVEGAVASKLLEQSRVWESLDPEAALPIKLISQLFKAGGKRVRPTLAISAYLSLGGDPDRRELVELAAALELLHCFALLQDDVMDECDLRRGQPSGHWVAAEHHVNSNWHGDPERFGESTAILAGDLAVAYADAFITRQPPVIRDFWTKMRTTMIIGQHLDLVLAARRHSSEELIRSVARLKSGQYSVEYPMVLGAALATGNRIPEPLSRYSLLLGEAFQLRDDLVSAFGDVERTGKPSGLDQKQGRLNLLAVSHTDLSPMSDDGENTPDRIRTSGEKRITDLVTAAAAVLKDSELVLPWQEEFEHLAHSIALRDH